MNGKELSRALRQGSGNFLEQRRQAVALSLLASAAMSAVTLYQMGVIRRLPEPPLPFLNAEKVDASPEAYNRLQTQTPDAAFGLMSYGATVVLAAMAGPDRARAAPLIPIALAAKAILDAVNAGYLTWEQIAKHRALCSYCLVAAAASVAIVPVVLPEARLALQNLKSREA